MHMSQIYQNWDLNVNAIYQKAITPFNTFDINFVVQNIFINPENIFDSLCLNKGHIKVFFLTDQRIWI